MSNRMAALSTSSVLLALAVAWSATTSAQPDAAPAPLGAAEIREMFDELSNWGRWGENDQRGTLNLVTPAKRRQAAALVREGISVSLSQNLSTEQAVDNTRPMQLIMTAQPGSPVAMDEWRIFYHGLTYAHMDALCHARFEGKAYNGFAETDAAESGCARSGIEHLKDGVLSRGILIDVPRLKGVDYFAPGTPVLASDIEAWEREAGVRIESGDVVFIRTGRWGRRSARARSASRADRRAFTSRHCRCCANAMRPCSARMSVSTSCLQASRASSSRRTPLRSRAWDF